LSLFGKESQSVLPFLDQAGEKIANIRVVALLSKVPVFEDGIALLLLSDIERGTKAFARVGT
jgi:hypothetical protein